jgi:ferredoxin
MPEFSCPELGNCHYDCTPTGACVRACAFDFFTLGSDEEVAQLAALQCERLDGPLIVYGGVTSLAGLETIHTVTRQVAIYDAPELEDISGLSGLETVGGRILLSVLAVTEIEFQALEEVGAGLLFVSLLSAQHILLPKLTSVREDCDINSTSATEIDLDALEHVSGKMRIFSNPNLTTLNELPSLVEAQSLEIAMNESFPQCEADAIAARLSVACPLCTDNSEVCP